MLAEKLTHLDPDLTTRPINARPLDGVPLESGHFEAVPPSRTHLMLACAPRPTPRGLAWARRGGAPSFDAPRLESMLRLELLNLG